MFLCWKSQYTGDIYSLWLFSKTKTLEKEKNIDRTMKWNFYKCQLRNLKWHETKDGGFLC